ncbi:Mob1 family protein [Histoplasma capsulatum var. duboisii H88]|uniref:Mob1 family protein n=2 Tax=Ajellomyces capsulatus TaxID=5037 RepID=F0U783_AJEC8|nr:Mob1 family protein [Histoplasma capsulatum H143]EGC41557.1 Mob1 family protein [Histoplasma capsulatum var. duboisii H88]QSS52012.1 Mob1 family protein [Histoplasma capsulatum var. duboisii H88]
MTTAGASPSSSPRLPSPPPFTEVQIGPQSPTVGEGFGATSEEILGLPHEPDDASMRRIRPGTKSADMSAGPPLVPLSQLDSPFQLQEHLKALYQHYTRPTDSLTLNPITRDIARDLAEPPEGVERSLWLYELCRFLTMKANNLIVAFFAEDPPCSAQTCPEMRASEWQYLCAVHDPPKSCCAIDYCCHTLDWAANILTSPKYFPSRLTLGSESSGGPQTSMKHLTNIFRRVYRIFAHAWFQHREVFWQVEGHDGLYIFFKTVCDIYNLIPEDNYTVPKEAEGLQPPSNPDPEHDSNKRMTIMRKESETRAEKPSPDELSEQTMLNVAATTRRHKATPSVGAIVPTITEAAEDDDDTSKNRQLPDEEDSDLKLPDPSVSETKPGQLSVPSVEAPANDGDLTETRAPDDDGMEKSGAITPPPVEPTSESNSQEQSEKPNDSPKQEESNDSLVNKEIDVFEPDTPVDDSKAIEVDLPKENPTIPEPETPKPENDSSDGITDIDPVSPDLPGSPGSPEAPTTAIEVKAADSDKPF